MESIVRVEEQLEEVDVFDMSEGHIGEFVGTLMVKPTVMVLSFVLGDKVEYFVHDPNRDEQL